MAQEEDAKHFLQPLDPAAYNVSKEDYEKAVKQPMDLGTIQKRLTLPLDQAQAYKNTATFSKDVNRIFNNVMKVWSPGEDEIANATQRLQSWWMGQWQTLVPILMNMKPDAETGDDEGETKDPDSGDLETCAAIHNERGDDYQEQIGMPEEVCIVSCRLKVCLYICFKPYLLDVFTGKHARLVAPPHNRHVGRPRVPSCHAWLRFRQLHLCA